MHSKEIISRLLVGLAASALIIGMCAIGGTSDYDEQVILSMPQSTYDSIRDELYRSSGEEPSQHQIVVAFRNRLNHY